MSDCRNTGYPKIEKVAKNESITTYEICKEENSANFFGRDDDSEWVEQSCNMKIPYFEDVKSSTLKSLENLENVFMVSNSETIAIKCALYLLENEPSIMANRELDELEAAVQDPYGIYEDFQYEFEPVDATLKLVKCSNHSASTDAPVNTNLKVLESVAGEVCFYSGLDNEEGIDERVDAILADDRKRKYIWITKNQLNHSWVTKLRTEFGFAVCKIEDVPTEYYEKVFSSLLKETGYTLDKNTSVWDVVNHINKQFGNDFSEEKIEWMINHAVHEKKQLDKKDNKLTLEDFALNHTLEESAINRLTKMPGLAEIKQVVIEQTALRKEIKRNPLLKSNHSHMIFYGNPGTGKTTCARLMAEIMSDYGVKNTTFVEATRSDIIGQYVGFTSKKIADLFKRARGGILFVDEAGFFLNTGAGGYVTEAIKEFVRFMENCPDVMVIFAMYEKEAENFLKLDEGLRSRISRMVGFRDYNESELQDIFKLMVKSNGYRLEKNAINLFNEHITSKMKDKNFGNAREVRKIFEAVVIQHSVRLINSDKANNLLSEADISAGINSLKQTPKTKVEFGFRCTTEGREKLALCS